MYNIRRKRFSYESWFKSLDAEEPLPISVFTKAGHQLANAWLKDLDQFRFPFFPHFLCHSASKERREQSERTKLTVVMTELALFFSI